MRVQPEMVDCGSDLGLKVSAIDGVTVEATACIAALQRYVEDWGTVRTIVKRTSEFAALFLNQSGHGHDNPVGEHRQHPLPTDSFWFR